MKFSFQLFMLCVNIHEEMISFFGNIVDNIHCNYVYDRFHCIAYLEDFKYISPKDSSQLLIKIREHFDEKNGLIISENITGYFI